MLKEKRLKRVQKRQFLKFAYFSSKISKKWKKWSPFFLGTWILAFLVKIVKRAYVQVPKSGTLFGQIEKRRQLFHVDIPPKWWKRHLFGPFSNFGWIISKVKKNSLFGQFWAVFLWAWTQKLAGDVRGQFKSQWLNPNIFEFSEGGSVPTISASHLKIWCSVFWPPLVTLETLMTSGVLHRS